MSQERTEAIVVRGVDFSESSRIVTFLTPDRGLMACMAAGVRRPKSELAALLDTFNRVELVYYWRDSRSVQKLGSVSLLAGYTGLKSDLDKAMYGALALELVYKAAHENEPSHALYATLAQGLGSLEFWRGSVRSHVAWQMVQLLTTAGFAPNLGGELTGFDYDSGFVAGPGDIRLTRAERTPLAALARADACPAVDISEKAFGALVRFAERQLESAFRSARVIERMYAS